METHLSDELISELADADPEAELDEAVAEHLALCDVCREELSLARVVNDALDAVPRMVAPPALFEGVMAGVARAGEEAQLYQRRALAVTLSLVTMALTVVLLWLASGGAATLAVEALETVRSLDLVTRIATSVWRAIPTELLVLCTVVLLGSSAALNRLLARLGRAPDAAAEAAR